MDAVSEDVLGVAAPNATFVSLLAGTLLTLLVCDDILKIEGLLEGSDAGNVTLEITLLSRSAFASDASSLGKRYL